VDSAHTERKPLPLYIRIGEDGSEHHIGDITPDPEDGTEYDEMALARGVAGLFRAAAWAVEHTNFAELLETMANAEGEEEADDPPSTVDIEAGEGRP